MKSTVLVAVLLALTLTACSQKAAEAPATPAPVVEAPAPASAPVVDVVFAPTAAPVNTVAPATAAAPTASLAAGIQVVLKADSGKYLARCNNCMPRGAYPDSAFVHVAEAQLANTPWAHFTLEHLSNGKYALKGDAGKYLALCNNCISGTKYPDTAFMHVSEAQLASAPWAQFTLKQLANGKYALQADSGKYLARCNKCIPGGSYPDSAFVHVTEAELMGSPWAQWDLIIVP